MACADQPEVGGTPQPPTFHNPAAMAPCSLETSGALPKDAVRKGDVRRAGTRSYFAEPTVLATVAAMPTTVIPLSVRLAAFHESQRDWELETARKHGRGGHHGAELRHGQAAAAHQAARAEPFNDKLVSAAIAALPRRHRRRWGAAVAALAAAVGRPGAGSGRQARRSRLSRAAPRA
jgi:hypothetical protein